MTVPTLTVATTGTTKDGDDSDDGDDDDYDDLSLVVAPWALPRGSVLTQVAAFSQSTMT